MQLDWDLCLIKLDYVLTGMLLSIVIDNWFRDKTAFSTILLILAIGCSIMKIVN